MQVLSPYNKQHEIYIGSQIGTLKKCTTNSQNKDSKDAKKLKEIKNLKDTCETDVGSSITSMCWINPEKTQILFAQKNNVVRLYNTKKENTKLVLRVEDKNPIVGVFQCKRITATCTNEGNLTFWENEEKQKEINVGKHVSAFQQCSSSKNLLVTGGKDNNTRIWDINTGTSTFTAKNEPHDALQMEVPVWVSDSVFLPENESLVATSSRYGKTRLYDVRTQRRPVTIVDVQTALTAISPCYHQERMVLVGTTTGTMQLIDLRAKGRALNTYKDFAGSVTKIYCDDKDPFIVSVSLDRFLRVHHRDTKKLVYKVYIKTKPSCLLVKNIENKTKDIPEDAEEEIQDESDSEDDCLSGLPTIQ